MLLLPNNLKCVADFADKKESGARWAVTGVQVEDHGKGKYTVVATDTKVLVVVEGVGQKAEEYPEVGALKDAPNGGTKGLIPAKLFAEVMTESAKKTKSSTKPILKTVALQMSAPTGKYGSDNYDPGQAVLGWTNLEQHATPTTKMIDGRFPPYKDIIPKRPPLARIAFDPEFITRLGEVCKQIKPMVDKESCRVEVDFYGSQKPCIFRFENPETEQKATVLIMPLASSFENDGLLNDDLLAADVETNKMLKAGVLDLTKECNDLKSENRELSSDRAYLKEQIEILESRIAAFEADMKGMEEELLRVRQQLSACQSDKEMYRQRAETVTAGA